MYLLSFSHAKEQVKLFLVLAHLDELWPIKWEPHQLISIMELFLLSWVMPVGKGAKCSENINCNRYSCVFTKPADCTVVDCTKNSNTK